MTPKEISYEKALKLIQQGKAVKCQTDYREDKYEVVHTASKLRNLYELSKQGVQLCKIYPILEKKVKLSENVLEVSFDEACDMIVSKNVVFYKNEDGEEEEITSVSELVNLRRTSEARGNKLVLYWHE